MGGGESTAAKCDRCGEFGPVRRTGWMHLCGRCRRALELARAIDLAEGSGLLKKCLGEDLFGKFLANKRLEWEAYRTQVTDYELQRYLPIL